MRLNPTPLARILREQREAAATLPAPGAVLGVSDWVAEEVLLLTGDPATAGNAPRTRTQTRARAAGER